MSFLSRMPRWLALAAFWAAFAGIGVLSLLPPELPLPSTGWDKANHALAFMTLALLAAACWPARRMQVLLGLAAYGAAIEVAQSLTGIRIGEWVDWAADVAGLALALPAWTRVPRPGG